MQTNPSLLYRHTMTVQEPVKDWKSGDVIVIASTDYDFKQAERFVVNKVSKDGLTIEYAGEVCGLTVLLSNRS